MKEKVLFYSKMQHPKLVMETKKTFKSDGEASQGKVIQFDRHHFETSDETIIEFIRNHPLFGFEYVEVKQRALEPAPVGKPTVASMEGEEDQKLQAFRTDIMNQVNSKFDQLLTTITSLLPAEAESPVAKDGEKDDTTVVPKKQGKSEASQNKK
jgi:hypothetical protein